jgi:hypothetical protein
VIRELERVRKEFQTNPHWQFIDREGYWICPFCLGLQSEVRLTSPLSVPSSVIEKAYHHLWSRCPGFKPSSPQLKPLPELHEALRRSNDQKTIIPRQKLDRMETELAALKDRAGEMEDSVKRASERQRRLLPAKAPDVPGTEIDLIYRPAAVVSGDFYDFVPLDDGKIAILIGDVSGHGIEAGILMGMANKVLAIRLQDYQDPVEASGANEDVEKDLGRVNFVTVFPTIYDPRGGPGLRPGGAQSSAAVQPGPGRTLPVIRRRGWTGHPGDRVLRSDDPTEVLAVMAGDLPLLYTDGLVEARNQEGGSPASTGRSGALGNLRLHSGDRAEHAGRERSTGSRKSWSRRTTSPRCASG